MRRSISDTIRHLLTLYPESPKQINKGKCADFAADVVKWHKFARVVHDSDLCEDPYSHSFVVCGGRYYDAETPDGVDNWMELPIYQRFPWE